MYGLLVFTLLVLIHHPQPHPAETRISLPFGRGSFPFSSPTRLSPYFLFSLFKLQSWLLSLVPSSPGTEPRVLHMLGKRYLTTSSGLPLSSRGKQVLVTISQTRKQNQRDQVHSQVHGTVVSDTHFLMPIFPALLANRKSRGTDIVRVTRT